nr:immunoglobulin light chain junction region [Macaca mulatta]MPN81209.1 immunoglobulin light chain junction region [Macaca mulatta]
REAWDNSLSGPVF